MFLLSEPSKGSQGVQVPATGRNTIHSITLAVKKKLSPFETVPIFGLQLHFNFTCVNLSTAVFEEDCVPCLHCSLQSCGFISFLL